MFVKVYHSLFRYHLTPNALKIYLYLTVCQNCLGNAIVRTQTIAFACGVKSLNTVRTALAELEVKGLVVKYTRKNSNGEYIANGYHITRLNGKWFAVPSKKEVFQLDKSAFAVFCYLCKCKNRKNRCFPSLAQLSSVLAMAKNTVIMAIKKLMRLFLLEKAPKRAGKHNLYIVAQGVPTFKNEQKNSTAKELCYSSANMQMGKMKDESLTKIIPMFRKIVKSALKYIPSFLLGGAKIEHQYIEPPS